MTDLTQRYDILLDSAELSHYDTVTERWLLDLAGYFHDTDAYERLSTTTNPLLYKVYGTTRPTLPGELISGITQLYPGKVGDEYFMTKGHFHAVLETAEVYYCLRGTGLLVLESPEGDTKIEPFAAGRVVQIPPRWAHRTVNTGDEELIFFWVCPANAGHDYGTIVERGFRQRVIDRSGESVVVEQ